MARSERVFKRRLLCLAASAAIATTVLAQQEQKVPTFSKDVKVVNVLATVRDKHGKIVNNLSQSDFVLEEDGRPQEIRYFSRETDLPLTLGLLVDTSVSQRNTLDQERSASGTFLDQVLRENKDSAFLIHFDKEVELLQDLTQSRQKLENALGDLQIAQPEMRDQQQRGGGYPGGGGNDPDGNGGGRRRGGGSRQRAGTLLYDSVYLASKDLMQKQHGRKAVIVLSDGVDRGSKTSLEGAIESAQRANTIVYSIYFAGQENGGRGGSFGHGGMGGPWGRRGGGYPGGGYPGGGYPGGGYPGGGGGRYPRQQEQHVDGKKILDQISKATGGRMFEVSKKETLDKIYQQIQDDLRNQYNLGYTPNRASDDLSDYHKIHLTTKNKDLVVQARDGYYSNMQLDSKQGN
jgi:VWFA-related protein